MRAPLLFLLVAPLACGDARPPRALSITRLEAAVTVEARAGERLLSTTRFALQGNGVRVERREEEALIAWLELADGLDTRSPVPEASAGSADLQDSLQISAQGVVAGARRFSFAADPQGARALLGAGALGRVLRELAELHVHVPALMAETEGVFRLVALVMDTPRERWPTYVHPDDQTPPGFREGDVLGLGMSCAVFIRCTGAAQYCVSAGHGLTYGFCSRACVDDVQCAGAQPGGTCSLSVTDTPGISGAVRMCAVGCVAGACPGLLRCAQDLGHCLPGQE